jgi:hypothetical protein
LKQVRQLSDALQSRVYNQSKKDKKKGNIITERKKEKEGTETSEE